MKRLMIVTSLMSFSLLCSSLSVAGELHKAVEMGDLAKVEALIKSGADVNEKDSMEYTPLNHAAIFGKKEIAVLLIEKGADVNGGHGRHVSPPLRNAASSGYKEIVELSSQKART
jgi:ankyrin repeat protein